MRNRLKARRFVAWLLLTVAVSLGHVFVPWALGIGSRQVEFANRAPTESVTLVVRAKPTPSAPAPLPVPRTEAKRSAENRPPQQRALRPDAAQREDASTPPPAESSPTTQATPLDDTSGDAALIYAVSGQFGGHTVGGSATLQWKIDPDAFLLSLHVTGSRQFKTVFAWQLETRGRSVGNSMQPESYEEDRAVIGEGRQTRSVSFSGEAARDSSGPRMDPLSALLKLCSDLHTRSDSAQPYPIAVRSANRSLLLTFERQGEEELQTAFGTLRTEKYVTKYPNAFYIGPQISLWLAPGFRHAPLRVQVEEPEVANLSFDLLSEPAAFPAWR